MDDPKTATMHAAAQRVLATYRSTGEPFTLFLSSWSVDEQRKEVDAFLREIGLRDQTERDVQVRIGLERQVRILLKKAGFETVAVYRKGAHKRIAMPEEWPSLTLDDKEWRERVSEIVAQADLITLFWGSTTPGLTEEMEMCSSGTTPLKTVIVAPGTPLEIWISQIQKTFPRVVPLQAIPPLSVLHPEFDRLIARMMRIK